MFSRNYLIILVLANTFFAFGQLKKISLEQIWDRSFETESIDAIHSMKSGQEYSIINFNATSIKPIRGNINPLILGLKP